MSTDLANSLYTPAQQRWQRWLTGSTILIAIAMLVVDHPLKTTHAPLGIISLQLAGDTLAAKQVVYDWHPRERLAAAFGLGLDYLFMCSYATWMFFGCRWAAVRWLKSQPTRGKLFGWLAWGAVLAAVLDGAENIVLLIFLQSDGRSVLYPLAFWCAVAKFLVILMLVGIWISGLFVPRDGATPKPVVPPKKP
jgi:hypothetical protein